MTQEKLGTNMKSDTRKLVFVAETHRQKYGDNRTFSEYKIIMRLGLRVVGLEVGPRRTHADRHSSLRAARRRIEELRSHNLFVIRVTNQDIASGRARDCRSCAIAQALWRKKEQMDLTNDHYFEVIPYGAWIEEERIGIFIRNRYQDKRTKRLAKLPAIALGGHSDGMEEWAMHFDEWEESCGIPVAEWREEHGHADDEPKPYRPCPCSFVLDLTAFQEVAN